MTSRRFAALSAVLAAALVAVPVATARAQFRSSGGGAAPPSGYRPAAGIDERVGADVPLDLVFRDEDEKPITLRDCTQGKPTILVPVYYRCPVLCTKVLNGLVEALREMPQDYSVGDKFNVVTVSMDDREHADLARAKKKAYLDEYGRPGAEAGWRFLTGSKESVAALLAAIGYRFEYDKVFKEYNHPSGIVILTPSGKVARYFYGIGYTGEFGVTDPNPEFTLPGGKTTLRLSLVEASEGKMGSLLEKLTLLCYRFDNMKGYSLSVLRAVQIGGVLTLAVVATGVALAVRRERRRERRRAAATTPGPNEGTNDGPPSGGTA